MSYNNKNRYLPYNPKKHFHSQIAIYLIVIAITLRNTSIIINCTLNHIKSKSILFHPYQKHKSINNTNTNTNKKKKQPTTTWFFTSYLLGRTGN